MEHRGKDPEGIWLQLNQDNALPVQSGTNDFNETVSLSTEWGYHHAPHRTEKKKINEEGINIAHGHLACQGQLWVAMTHSPTKFAKPPPEDCPASQALTRHLENASFLPRHRCCTWEWLQRAIFSPRPWIRTRILLCLHKWVSDDHIFLRLCLPWQEQSELRRGVKNPNEDLIPTTSYIPNWVMWWAHWQTSLKQRSLTVKIFFLFKIKNSNSTVLSYNNQRITLALGL